MSQFKFVKKLRKAYDSEEESTNDVITGNELPYINVRNSEIASSFSTAIDVERSGSPYRRRHLFNLKSDNPSNAATVHAPSEKRSDGKKYFHF